MRADLAGVIAEARRAAGLSQAHLARRAGISPSYLSRIESAAWERGGPWPADAVLRALARALGISSTELVALRRAARDRQAPAPALARRGWGTRCEVSVGPQAVDAAARDLVVRNPLDGALRSAQVLALEADPDAPSYLDTLGSAMATRPDAILYRVCASDRRHVGTAQATVERLAVGRSAAAFNVRTRFAFANPLVLDVLIGDNEVLLAVPDRRGHPHLRAGVVVDDPDFVAAARDWFDESVWDPPCGYADVRGEGIDDAFAAIKHCLAGTADRRRRLKPLEAMGAGDPVSWSP